MSDLKTVGPRLRIARLQRGMNQRTLAGLAGLSPGFISLLENGERFLQRHEDLIALADALSVSPAELLGQPFPADASGSAAHMAIPALRMALLGCAPLAPAPMSMRDLAEMTRRSTELYHACEYAAVAKMLPQLLGALTAALEDAHGDQRRELLLLQARAYQPGCVLLCKALGYIDLAWIAVDKATRVSQEMEDPLGPALNGFYRTHVLLAAGATSAALEAAAGAEQDVAGQLRTHAAAALFGELHLISATTLSASRAPNSAGTVAAHLSEAAQAAARTGETKLHGLNFGPTNVGIHRVTTAVDQGEYGRAIDSSLEVHPTVIDAPGRHAAYFSGLARAYCRQRGQNDKAVAALVRAEAVAPQRVRTDPMLIETVGVLSGRRLSQRAGQDMRRVANRMGLTD